ncbi:MAG: hypothetical protein AVDCRST_MAG91-3041, partial [uncultured Sphingomonadaceae bacterium]
GGCRICSCTVFRRCAACPACGLELPRPAFQFLVGFRLRHNELRRGRRGHPLGPAAVCKGQRRAAGMALRPHYRFFARASAPRAQPLVALCGGRRCNGEQVPDPVQRQAHLQSRQFRGGGGGAAVRPHVDYAGPMGTGQLDRWSHHRLRSARAELRPPPRHRRCVSRHLCPVPVRPCSVSGRSGRDPAPPAPVRRIADLHRLHDHRSALDPGPSRRAHSPGRVCRSAGAAAVDPLPTGRLALVRARFAGAAHPGHRPRPSSQTLPVASQNGVFCM